MRTVKNYSWSVLVLFSLVLLLSSCNSENRSVEIEVEVIEDDVSEEIKAVEEESDAIREEMKDLEDEMDELLEDL